MNSSTMKALVERVERLERVIWLWKVLGSTIVGLLGFIVVLGATAAKVPDEVRARRFTLVGKAGETRAMLTEWTELKPSLTPSGAEALLQGKEVKDAWTSKPSRFVGLFLLDKTGRHRAKLILREDEGTPSLNLYGEAKSYIPNASLSVGKLGADLSLYSQDPLRVATLRASDSLFLHLTGENLMPGAALIVEADGSAALTFHDNDRKVRARFGVKTDKPYLELSDKNGKARAILGHIELKRIRTGVVEQRPESSLVLIDENEKVIWQAP